MELLERLPFTHIEAERFSPYPGRRVQVNLLPPTGSDKHYRAGHALCKILNRLHAKQAPQQEGAQPSTINRNLTLLRRMLNLGCKEGKLRSVPYFPMLKENPARKDFVTHEQFAKHYAALQEYLHPLILVLYWAGYRLREARQIDWEQIDVQRRQITFYREQTKNADPRILPLRERLVELLKSVRNKKGRVFYQGEFRRSWMHACCAVGLGRRTKNGKGWYTYEGSPIHDLRRSAVRNLREAGVSESVIMKITGHKTRSVFDRYSIVSTADLQNAMRRIQAEVLDIPKASEKIDASLIQVHNKDAKATKTTSLQSSRACSSVG